jgi:hypothetical protein
MRGGGWFMSGWWQKNNGTKGNMTRLMIMDKQKIDLLVSKKTNHTTFAKSTCSSLISSLASASLSALVVERK